MTSRQRFFVQQWKPLNVITLGQFKIDNINRRVTIVDEIYLNIFSKRTLKCDHIKRLITLTSEYIKRL